MQLKLESLTMSFIWNNISTWFNRSGNGHTVQSSVPTDTFESRLFHHGRQPTAPPAEDESCDDLEAAKGDQEPQVHAQSRQTPYTQFASDARRAVTSSTPNFKAATSTMRQGCRYSPSSSSDEDRNESTRPDMYNMPRAPASSERPTDCPRVEPCISQVKDDARQAEVRLLEAAMTPRVYADDLGRQRPQREHDNVQSSPLPPARRRPMPYQTQPSCSNRPLVEPHVPPTPPPSCNSSSASSMETHAPHSSPSYLSSDNTGQGPRRVATPYPRAPKSVRFRQYAETEEYSDTDYDDQHGSNDTGYMSGTPVRPKVTPDRQNVLNDSKLGHYIKLVTPTVAKRRRSRRKEKEPSRYDGKSDLRDYLLHFTKVAKTNGWSYEDCGLELGSSLIGDARSVLGDIPEELEDDYIALVQALINCYDPDGRESKYSTEFLSRRCGPREDVATFGQDLKRLAKRAYPGWNLPEQVLIDLFIKGLPHPRWQENVALQEPASLTKAITLATKCETFQIAKKTGREMMINAVPGQEDSVAVVNQVQSTPQLGNILMQQIPVDPYRPQGLKKDTVRCYQCYGLGHFSTECQYPKDYFKAYYVANNQGVKVPQFPNKQGAQSANVAAIADLNY